MRYEFKQAVLLRSGPAGTGGKHHIFSKGVHEVSAEQLKHPTMVHMTKHELVIPFKPKDGPKELKAASSDIAKGAEAAAKASQVDPDAEIGGDTEPDFGDDKKSKKKGK